METKHIVKAGVLGLIVMSPVLVPWASAQSISQARQQKLGQFTLAQNQNSKGDNWEAEDLYWRNHYSSRPYYREGKDYTVYQPAYRYGVDTYRRHPGKPFENLNESELRSGWEQVKGESKMRWEEVKAAVQDAYNRLYNNSNPDTQRGSRKDTKSGKNKSPVPRTEKRPHS